MAEGCDVRCGPVAEGFDIRCGPVAEGCDVRCGPVVLACSQLVGEDWREVVRVGPGILMDWYT